MRSISLVEVSEKQSKFIQESRARAQILAAQEKWSSKQAHFTKDACAIYFAWSGALPADAIDDILGQIKGLDMDDVRKQIAEAEAAGETPQEEN